MDSVPGQISASITNSSLLEYYANVWNIKALLTDWDFMSKGTRLLLKYHPVTLHSCRSQWPRGIRRSYAGARLLRSWVRIPLRAWMFVCCECCVLSSRGLCDELITRSEESYRLWCVVVCDLETSRMRRSWLALGRSATKKNIYWF